MKYLLKSYLQVFGLITFVITTNSCATGSQVTRGQDSPADLGKRQVGSQGMVSSASPLASEAGLEILRAGGNAVDAAVATAFAIGVVEPQMSGIGGSGSMLIWTQETAYPDYLNFYAAQPVEAFRALEDPRIDSTTPLRIVGVPGNVAGLLEAHRRFGSLSREEVMAPALRLAEDGFSINQVLAQMISMDSARLASDPLAKDLYLPGGRPLQAGSHFTNPQLARSLSIISAQGRDGFYRGALAEDLVSAMNKGGHPITLEQLASYEPQWKRPLCGVYRDRIVLSAPPPQTGIQIIHTLKLLEPYDLSSLGYPTQSPDAFQVLTSALRSGMTVLTMNDDPNWATVPANGLISGDYARGQSDGVGTMSPPDTVRPGVPHIFDNQDAEQECLTFEPYGPAREVGND
ncbi:MAG: gamma-glutamyltransferase, partial [Gemmatimonadota bacterium]|nr:gamma-glutamyltransferase [Gemmatimonadota bacterium]